MELINQHTKKIMEGCKERARQAGLRFENESLEYILTNRDLLELTPKVMIPTLYDFWVHDLEVLKERGKYELYPSNPYETVINTRPAISFYNDNNPDWLNVMIFYHVLAHIDFFQNNLYFRHTWDYDFTGQALSDKRVIAKLRSEKGRWVDYVIEFARSIDNLVGYFEVMAKYDTQPKTETVSAMDYYLDIFLQDKKRFKMNEYVKEVERYNTCVASHGDKAGKSFFADVYQRYPEFKALYKKFRNSKPGRRRDLMQYLMENSKFINKESNTWVKTVLQIVRNTSLFFQPQIRTKIMNEGWASYWHEKLFLVDDRIRGHESDFARTHAMVTSLPRVGLNPYALGMRIFQFIENQAEKGRFCFDYEKLRDEKQRKSFDTRTGRGKETIFQVRENFCDFSFINTFTVQEFVNQHKLFVTARRLNQEQQVWEYYIKSRSAHEFKRMILNNLYHPPYIEVVVDKTNENELFLRHHFEEKPLVAEYIKNTLMGIEYLWGGKVFLETHEVVPALKTQGGPPPSVQPGKDETRQPQEIKWQKVRYAMKDRRLTKEKIY